MIKNEKTMKTGWWMGILILFFTFALLSVSSAQDVKEYKIGALFAITGSSSFLGEPEANTAKMLVEEINKKGGIKGIPIKLIIYDTEGNPVNAKTKVKKLIEEDKVDAIIGPTVSGTSLAIITDCENAGIPLLSCASSVKIVDPVKKNIFKTAQSDRDAVLKVIDYLKKKEIKKVAIITVSNAFGDSGKEHLVKLLPENGIEIIAAEQFGNNDTDATAQLTKIKGTVAEAVICWGTNPGPAVVTKNMKQLGMKQILIQSHGVASMKFIELAGKDAEGIVLPAGSLMVAEQLPDSHPQKAVLLKYTKEYKEKFNSSVSTFGGHAYDSLMILVNAMEKAGNDKAKICEEIEKTKNFVGVTGIFNMSATDHNGLDKSAFSMIEIKDGKWKLIE